VERRVGPTWQRVIYLISQPGLRRALLLLAQLVLMAGCYFAAFFLRFEFQIPRDDVREVMWLGLPILLVSRLPWLIYMRLVAGWWRYVSTNDLLRLVQALSLGTVCTMAILVFVFHASHFPRSVFLLEWTLSLIMLGGARMSVRLLREVNQPLRTHGGRGLLLVGAGDAGELVLRELRNNPSMDYRIVGFVDDDARKHGMDIQGVRVLGSCEDIPRLVNAHRVHEVLLAIPSATGREVRRIVDITRTCQPPPKMQTLPGIGDIIGGNVTVDQIRRIELEDLLGREPVDVDLAGIHAHITGRNILVTGAGGSVGSELCRQILRFAPRMLVLLERSENHLYDIEQDLRRRFPDMRLTPLVGDVCHAPTVATALREHDVEVVFHAAAYKHVPIVERNPFEAVANNVFGTETVVRAAIDARVKRFVFISTDKAVHPHGIMGATKRLGERIVHAANSDVAAFVSVRFGNVLGSSGSVVPLFRQQIASGGPVTVTHPETTRYFMTLREAVLLVLQAASFPETGRTFVLNMGLPVRILDLARRLIELTGQSPDDDISIRITGMRPGEKLHEELVASDEVAQATTHPKLMAISGAAESFSELQARLGRLRTAVELRNLFALKNALRELVPGYEPDGFVVPAAADANESPAS
jgi:FlaA1/EpsC-like NDP-sugar epimerase